jgi:hypothetical protein
MKNAAAISLGAIMYVSSLIQRNWCILSVVTIKIAIFRIMNPLRGAGFSKQTKSFAFEYTCYCFNQCAIVGLIAVKLFY